jgi:hypothetical protein
LILFFFLWFIFFGVGAACIVFFGEAERAAARQQGR